MKNILFAAALLAAMLSLGFAQYAAESSKMKNAALQAVTLGDIREFDANEMLKKVPLMTDKLIFNTYFFQPRQTLRLHKHPSTDELFYIAEGRGQFVVGDKRLMVNAGAAVYGPANVPHGIVNSGDGQLVMLSVQSPKPVKKVDIENSAVNCPVCGQENIIPADAREGDIVTCPRCKAKFRISKMKDGKWRAEQV